MADNFKYAVAEVDSQRGLFKVTIADGVISNVCIGPPDFENTSNEVVTQHGVGCDCGIFDISKVPCTCMVAAQNYRKQSPELLFPPSSTVDAWLAAFEAGGEFNYVSRDEISAALDELDPETRRKAWLPATIRPNQTGRPKNHTRYDDPVRGRLTNKPRAKKGELPKKQRQAMHKLQRKVADAHQNKPSSTTVFDTSNPDLTTPAGRKAVTEATDRVLREWIAGGAVGSINVLGTDKNNAPLKDYVEGVLSKGDGPDEDGVISITATWADGDTDHFTTDDDDDKNYILMKQPCAGSSSSRTATVATTTTTTTTTTTKTRRR